MLPETELIRIPAGTNFTLRGRITDAAEPPVALAAAGITSINWTMWELESGSDNKLIDNAALTVGTVVPSAGNFVLEITPAMNILWNTALKIERHGVRFVIVSGGKTYKSFTMWSVTKDPTP